MRLSQRLSQNLQVPSVTSCYNDDKAVLIGFDAVKAIVEIITDNRCPCFREALSIRIFFPVINDGSLEIYVAEHRVQRLGNMPASENIRLACCLEIFNEVSRVLWIHILNHDCSIAAAAHSQSSLAGLLLVKNEFVGFHLFLSLQLLSAELFCFRLQQASPYCPPGFLLKVHQQHRIPLARCGALGCNNLCHHKRNILFYEFSRYI